jgi:hypothetical protein
MDITFIADRTASRRFVLGWLLVHLSHSCLINPVLSSGRSRVLDVRTDQCAAAFLSLARSHSLTHSPTHSRLSPLPADLVTQGDSRKVLTHVAVGLWRFLNSNRGTDWSIHFTPNVHVYDVRTVLALVVCRPAGPPDLPPGDFFFFAVPSMNTGVTAKKIQGVDVARCHCNIQYMR